MTDIGYWLEIDVNAVFICLSIPCVGARLNRKSSDISIELSWLDWIRSIGDNKTTIVFTITGFLYCFCSPHFDFPYLNSDLIFRPLKYLQSPVLFCHFTYSKSFECSQYFGFSHSIYTPCTHFSMMIYCLRGADLTFCLSFIYWLQIVAIAKINWQSIERKNQIGGKYEW